MVKRPDCKNFADLRARYRETVDYKVETRPGDLRLCVIAPHGGVIEKGTERVARAIAGTDLSLHVLEGIKPRANPRLHITSTDYDQPDALNLVAKCQIGLGIHGLGSTEPGDKIIRMGGLNEIRKTALATALRAAGFQTVDAPAGLNATDPENICNRAVAHGVQLEMTQSLRDDLCSEAATMAVFVKAVRSGMGVLP